MQAPLRVTAGELPSVKEEQRKKESQASEEVWLFGAGDEARTRYLHLGKVALYRMSYTRNSKIDYSKKCENVNTPSAFFLSFFLGSSE